ncbi:MAG: alpha/beta hydrolase [Acidobacteriaceae bacterium]
MPAPTMGEEHDTTKPTDNLIAGRPLVRLGNVSVPTLTLYLAPKAKNTRAAVVVFPGGAYSILAMDLEGTEVCDWLNSIGVNCLLLKYRVPGSGPYPKSSAALQDAQRAIGMVRLHAGEWGIDPKRVGVLGFSAGGHLAAAISTHYDQRLNPGVDAADQESCKPDFTIVIYPGYLAIADRNFALNPDIPVTAATPPTFLVQAEDDPVHVENVIAYFMQLKRAGFSRSCMFTRRAGTGMGCVRRSCR